MTYMKTQRQSKGTLALMTTASSFRNVGENYTSVVFQDETIALP